MNIFDVCENIYFLNEKKAISLMNDLDKNADLIKRKRRELDRPKLIRVKSCVECKHENTINI